MAIDWSTIKPALVTLFGKLAVTPIEDVPEFHAQWRNRRDASEVVSPDYEQNLTLQITSCVGIGEDQRQYITEGEQLWEEITGLRRFTLNLRSEVSEYEDTEWALGTLERIRTSLKLRSSIDALLAVNVGIIRATDASDISRRSDGRVLSAGSMDVFLYTTAFVRGTDPIGWIERIKLTTHVKDPGGVELPPKLQLVGEYIPDPPPEDP